MLLGKAWTWACFCAVPLLVPSDSGQAPEGNAGRKIKTSVEKIKESCIIYHSIEGFCKKEFIPPEG